mmetsp:Transcript_67240/g.143918  ORF Transcript_67240/g.143918 Transcript_67240/m.143918 type:complete len:185 (-) Transcript_67240:657-1211(-)
MLPHCGGASGVALPGEVGRRQVEDTETLRLAAPEVQAGGANGVPAPLTPPCQWTRPVAVATMGATPRCGGEEATEAVVIPEGEGERTRTWRLTMWDRTAAGDAAPAAAAAAARMCRVLGVTGDRALKVPAGTAAEKRQRELVVLAGGGGRGGLQPPSGEPTLPAVPAAPPSIDGGDSKATLSTR